MALSPIHSPFDTATQYQGIHRITEQTRNLTLKASIVSTSVSFESEVRERPMEMVYKAAIDKLNETLEPELGPEAIQNAATSGMDFSPEAVAGRILDFATGFLSAYRENHPDTAGGEQLSGFMQLIGDAIDQGFEEAREILDGLGVLQGEVAANVDRTYDLIQEGLGAFERQTREEMAGTEV